MGLKKFLKKLGNIEIFSGSKPIKNDIDFLVGFWEGHYHLSGLDGQVNFTMEIERIGSSQSFRGFVIDLNEFKSSAKIEGQLVDNEKIYFNKRYLNHKYKNPLNNEVNVFPGEYKINYDGEYMEGNLLRGTWHTQNDSLAKFKSLHPEVREWSKDGGYWVAEKTLE